MVALCLVGGLGAILFEYWTYGNRVVRVDRVLWKVRVVGFAVLAIGGHLAFFAADLMPMFLPAIFATITAVINGFASVAELPPASKWKWAFFVATQTEKQKREEQAGKAPGLFDRLNPYARRGSNPRLALL